MEQIKKELYDIGGAQGPIHPRDIVRFAKRHKKSAIREWMDKKGAFDPATCQAKYAEIVARQLIMRVRCSIAPGTDDRRSTRALVSLSSDRKSGGGYRPIFSVLSDEEKAEEYVETCLRDFAALQKKYEAIAGAQRLRPIFQAIQKAIEQGAKKSRKKKAG